MSLIAATGYFFCLETKEAKIQVNPNASLPHGAFALQNGQNLGWKVLRLASPRLACASVKNSYALPYRTGLHRSARFRLKLAD